jgi:nitroimidazol reductase NimA-like FMN-containing flavoprotein (pyridoxamine 5'-phosphate oxidase superfamily)
MTAIETAEFLAERQHLVRVATVDGDGRPRVVPVWYLPVDEALLITPRAGSAWLANLKREPSVAAVIDEGVLPQRKVVIATTVEVLHDLGHDHAWRDVYRNMCLRYWEKDAVDTYLESTVQVRRALVSVPLRFGTPEVQTWRLPVEDEDPRGIWAVRYGPVIFGSGASSASC